jgi:tetratricopeptide (TPR) repeat protein
MGRKSGIENPTRGAQRPPRDRRASQGGPPTGGSAAGHRAAPSPLLRRPSTAVLLPVAIALLTLLAFWPALGGGFTNWDDPGYVTENYLIRDVSPQGLRAIFSTYVEGNYHPLTVLSLALDYHLWRLQPRGYHATSVALHVLATLIAYWLVLLLTGSRVVAAFVAVFFGIHPLHVESVAWVSGRKDVLYAVFYLSGCVSYVQWIQQGRARAFYYAGTLVLFMLSLLSKGMAVTFPVALLLIDFLAGRRATIRRAILEKLPFFLLSVLFGIVAIIAQQAKGALPTTPFPLLDRLLVACHGLLAYLVKGLVPTGLSAFYPYPVAPGTPLPAAFYAAPLGVIGLAIAVYLLGRRSRGVGFGALFYLANVLLVLQVFPVGSAIIADRYTYLSYVGFGLMLAESLRLLAGRIGARSAPVWVGGAVSLAVCAVLLIAATRARCEVWKSSDRLWSDVIRKHPNVEMAYKNRAVAAREAGRNEEAAADLERALALNPRDPEAWCNRGNVRFSKAQFDSALSDLDMAIRLDGRSAVSRNSRGAVYFSLGRLDEALADFDSALALKDAYPEAHLNRGNTLSLLKRYDRALADYDAYLRMQRTNPMAYYWRGLARRQTGDQVAAIGDFSEAIRLSPGLADAYFARSLALEARGDREAALRDGLQARALGSAVAEDYLTRLRSGRP